MCEGSLQRYLALFHSTGSVAPKQRSGGPGKILTDFEEVCLLQALIHTPTAFLHEIQSRNSEIQSRNSMMLLENGFMPQQFAEQFTGT